MSCWCLCTNICCINIRCITISRSCRSRHILLHISLLNLRLTLIHLRIITLISITLLLRHTITLLWNRLLHLRIISLLNLRLTLIHLRIISLLLNRLHLWSLIYLINLLHIWSISLLHLRSLLFLHLWNRLLHSHLRNCCLLLCSNFNLSRLHLIRALDWCNSFILLNLWNLLNLWLHISNCCNIIYWLLNRCRNWILLRNRLLRNTSILWNTINRLLLIY